MLSRITATLALLAVPGLNVIGAMADESCLPECINISRENFSNFGCTAKDEVGCLCVNAGFVDSINRCTLEKCGGASPDQIRGNLLAPAPGAFTCQNFAEKLPAPAKIPLSDAPSRTPPAPPPTTESSPSSSITSQPKLSPISTSTPTSNRTGTLTATASETPTTLSPVPDATGAISPGAAAGIGIGVALVVVAVAAIAFCSYRKRKSQVAPRHSLEISKPLPGSGRTYPTRDHDLHSDFYDKYNNDIEMTSNRYEDMVPSQQPRTMV